MAHFYGVLNGSRGEATRCGDASNGLITTAAGHQGAVTVYLRHKDGQDHFKVCLGPWQSSGGATRVLAEGILDANVVPLPIESAVTHIRALQKVLEL